jgi:D-psicose/D-tagatose/L-ribulose 3-epimerase
MGTVGPKAAISAIAWPQDEDDAYRALTRQLGFEGIEIAPVRIFGPLVEASTARLDEWRRVTEGEGLSIVAMQGLLFGVKDIHLFASDAARERLRDALRIVARTASRLGVYACVFGAPALRDPGDLDPALAFDQAVAFFRELAPAFEDAGCALCVEPVASALGGKFITTTAEAVALVRHVDRPGIRLQMDTGNLIAHGDGAPALAAARPIAAHLHVSEPGLAPVGDLGNDHAALGAALRKLNWSDWVSVEMLPASDIAAAMRRARDVVAAHYLARAAET